jgi:hypothetical protein
MSLFYEFKKNMGLLQFSIIWIFSVSIEMRSDLNFNYVQEILKKIRIIGRKTEVNEEKGIILAHFIHRWCTKILQSMSNGII